MCQSIEQNIITEKVRKNTSIEFCRFIAIMCVVSHHFCGRPGGGYLAVDFFSLITGFFLMQHFVRNKSENLNASISAVQYTFARYKRIIPYYLIAFIGGIIMCIFVTHDFSFKRLITDNIWELLMIDGFCITGNFVIGPGWYIQSMILSSFICYYLLNVNKDFFICILSPIIMLFTISLLVKKVGHLNYWLKPGEIIPLATIRVFAEISFGCTCFELYRFLKEKFKTLSYKTFILHTLIETICIIYIFYIVFLCPTSFADFIGILFMSILIISLYMEKSLFSKLLNNNFSLWLGKISIAIYLNHMFIQKINWGGILGLSWRSGYFLMLITVVISSFVETLIVDNIFRNLKNINK